MDKLLGVALLLALVCGAAGKSLPLPPYLTACSRREPDLSGCSLKRGREAIPLFINGDPKYKIPVLDPMLIPRLHVDEGVLGLNFTATDLVFTGLRNTFIKDIKWDPKKKTGFYDLSIPRVEIDCHYEISGRILILPITGSGRGNITLMNVTTKYLFDFDLVKKEDGSTYIIPSRSSLDLDTSRMYVQLDNLFNGNQLLGEEMNRFMDENWKDMVKELGPVIADAMGKVMRRIQTNVFELVDYDHAYPDVPL